VTEELDAPVANPKLSPVLVDPHLAPVQFVDWIVTSGTGPSPGTCNIDLAALDYGPSIEGQPRAILQCRLRMSFKTAANIHNALTAILLAAQPAQGSVN
jgi:hypothetical protein